MNLLFPIFAQVVSTNVNSVLNVMSQRLVRLADGTAGIGLYDLYLNPICTEVAKTLLPIILVTEIVFCGFRIMAGKPIIEQAARIMLASIICYAVVWLQLPQKAMRYTIRYLEDSGRMIGGQIAWNSIPLGTLEAIAQDRGTSIEVTAGMLAGGSANQVYFKFTPVVMWAVWVNPLNDTKSDQYKYGYLFIRNRIFPKVPQDLISAVGPDGKPLTPNRNYNESVAYGGIQNAVIRMQNDPRFMDRAMDASGIKNPLTGELADSMIGTMMPLTAMSLALPIAINILAGSVSPMFMTAAVVSGAYYSFYVILALGVAVVPLLYFESFKDIWQKYLKFMFAVSLVPMLFYVMMAVGFVFSTTTFDFMFPDYNLTINNNRAGMSAVYGEVFSESLAAALAASNPGATGIEKAFSSASLNLFSVFMTVGRHGAGCIVITGFILVGTAFGPTAVKLAFRWNEGFAENAVFDNVFQGFETIRGALTSALSVQMGTGMQVAQNVASGGLSALRLGGRMLGIGGK